MAGSAIIVEVEAFCPSRDVNFMDMKDSLRLITIEGDMGKSECSFQRQGTACITRIIDNGARVSHWQCQEMDFGFSHESRDR